MKLNHAILALSLFISLNFHTQTARAQGTAFSYNGRLNVNGAPASGSYDLSFTLCNAATNGTVFGALTNTATPVTNGLFTVTLDFGGVFNGSNYWLQIAARTNGAATFASLSPLQPITPAPYAIYSENAATAAMAVTAGIATSASSVAGTNITGTVPLPQLPAALLTNNQSGVTLSGVFNGNGNGLTNLPAASLTGTIADSLLSTNIARLNLANTNLQATASLVNTFGFITGTTNLFGGSGYTNNPVVIVTDATGSNAVITATVANGMVTSLTVQTAGAGYSTNATLTIAPPPTTAFQTINAISLFNNPGSTFAGSFAGNGASLTNVNLTGPSASAVLGSLADGYLALAANTTGYSNTAVGYQALAANTNGYANTASGCDALSANTSGYNNTANGNLALANNTTGYDNVANGAGALHHNTTGYQNTANGFQALLGNTTGIWNVAAGVFALEDNTTGGENTANGTSALHANTTGSENTANGFDTMYDSTTGGENTANGYEALYNNSTGSYNTANGDVALYSNTTGTENAANGGWALYSNTVGSYNTANGEDALHYSTTGSDNVANGFQSLFHNANGNWNTANGVNSLISNTIGSFNTADGNSALENNTNGNWNTACGFQSLWYNSSGSNNIALGSLAGYYLTTGNSNIDIGNVGVATDTNIIRLGSGQTQAFIAGIITGNAAGLTNLNLTGPSANSALANTANGYQALQNNLTGSNNVALGYQAGSYFTNGNNNIEIGNTGATNDNNTINIGTQGVQTNTAIAGIFGATAASGVPVYVTATGQLGTLTSSARFKTDIQTMDHASDVLLALHPVTFRYKPEIDPQGIPQFGLVAEDVAKVDPDLVAYDAQGKIYTVRYEAVNAMLLNEFLKQHQTVQEQATEIQDLNSRLEKLERAMETVK